MSTLSHRTLDPLAALAPLSRNHTHILQFWTADIISAVEFDSTGNYLATGDKGGRVVLFERNDMVCSAPFVTTLPTVANLTP